MLFSRSIFAAALVGLGAATTHGEAAMVTSSAAAMVGMASTATELMAAVSESKSTAAAMMMESTSKAMEAQMPASTGTQVLMDVTSKTIEAQMPASTGKASTEAEVNTHVVMVGESGLTFSPANVIAAPGDLVQFQFYPKVRSVFSFHLYIQNVIANQLPEPLRRPIHV